MHTLKSLAITKLSKDELKSLSDMDINVDDMMDGLLLSRMDPQIQLEMRGYYCTANNYRITSYTTIEDAYTMTVLYNNDNIITTNLYSSHYPGGDVNKYCGSVKAVLNLYTGIGKGTCEEYRDHTLYRKIGLKINNSGKWVIHGKFVQNFPDGFHEMYGKFVNDKMHGQWQKYYPGNCGMKIMLDYYFRNGEYDSSQRVMVNYKTALHYVFKNGKPICFERNVKHRDYDRYVASTSDGVIWEAKFYLGKVNVYPGDVIIDTTLPTIYNPESFPFPNVLE